MSFIRSNSDVAMALAELQEENDALRRNIHQLHTKLLERWETCA